MRYYGLFRAMGNKKAKTVERVFVAEDASYHDALYQFAPVQDWLRSRDGRDWRLEQISDSAFPMRSAEEMPSGLPDGLYYEAKHDYQQMIIEGTRLLGLKSDGKANGYGSYIRMLDTGETCYACANGEFFDHEETQRRIKQVESKCMKGFSPTDSFVWHPVLFPYGESGIDFKHFIASNIILTLPIHFWGSESYDKQIVWIMEREGVN